MASKTPTPKFVLLGKRGKVVHVAHNKRYDLAVKTGSDCQQLRKFTVADAVPKKGISPEAALALDMCTLCHTEAEAKALIEANKTPEQKREESKDRANETRAKIAKSQKSTKSKKKVAKEPKEPKPKKPPKKAKAGTRSTGDNKAQSLAEFGTEHGWSVKLTEAKPGTLLTAVKGEETITCYFDGNKFDTSRGAKVSVGNWSGKLRGVHGCRNQMALEGRDRPHPQPGVGRSGPRSSKKSIQSIEDEVAATDESPEDAARRVPFSVDDPEIEVLDIIKGTTIRWRNGTSGKVEEARVPDKGKTTRIYDHPKTGRRLLDFFVVAGTDPKTGREVLGQQRTVALDKIIRVIN